MPALFVQESPARGKVLATKFLEININLPIEYLQNPISHPGPYRVNVDNVPSDRVASPPKEFCASHFHNIVSSYAISFALPYRIAISHRYEDL
jgi:hypothetical protein